MIDFEALFKISYGLYIVSSGNEKEQNGFISNTVFQVTAEPPQFATCCNKSNYTAQFIERYGSFSVSVLHQQADASLIGRFGYKSGNEVNKFENTRFVTGPSGTPVVLDNCIAWMEVKVNRTIDVGSHWLFIGELMSSQLLAADAEPLTYGYYRRVKKGIAPKNAPTYLDKDKLSALAGKADATSDALYKCPACGYIYNAAVGDPDHGVPAGTSFEEVPDDWVCPLCGTSKSDFYLLENQI